LHFQTAKKVLFFEKVQLIALRGFVVLLHLKILGEFFDLKKSPGFLQNG
jgi:hypothetical protein